MRSLSGIVIPSSGSEQRRALDERRVDRRERALERDALLLLGRPAAVDAEQRPPDLLPDEVVGVRAERGALAEGDEAAAGPDAADELGDEARLAEARLGGDADDVAARRSSVRSSAASRAVELGPAPDDRELVAPVPPRGAPARRR